MKWWLGLVFVFTMSGCATFSSEPSQKISFHSDQDETEVYLGNFLVGVTPFEMSLPEKGHITFEFRKAGFLSKTITLENRDRGWMAIDIWGRESGHGYCRNTIEIEMVPLRVSKNTTTVLLPSRL